MRKVTKLEPSAENLTEPTKLRVAAYCRVSTDEDDQLESLDAQMKHYESTIQQNPNWTFAGIYYDRGITGTKKEKRPDFLRMITDCENKQIDLILTKSISRFSRNTTDCLELVRKLIGLGVYILFEKENIHTGSLDSELMLSILSGLAESESVSIAENSKWSVKSRFRNGTYKISSPPLGYDSVDGQLMINEIQAEIVRFIFSKSLSGQGAGKIVKELNRLEIPSKKGGEWMASAVLGILKNERYTGKALLQKTYTDDRFKRHINYGERDFFLIEDHHPAIISQEDFDAVQSLINQHRLEKNSEMKSAKYSNRYAFSGKILCAECGAKFKRRIHTKGEGMIAWCCSTHITNANLCSIKFIPETHIEYTFIVMMNKLIFGYTSVLKPLLLSLRGMNSKDEKASLRDLEKKLDENKKQRETLLALTSKGYLETAAFNKGNNELLQEASRLERQKESTAYYLNSEHKSINALLALIKYTVKASMLERFDADLFEQFVAKIHVYSRFEIGFELKCGLTLRERLVE